MIKYIFVLILLSFFYIGIAKDSFRAYRSLFKQEVMPLQGEPIVTDSAAFARIAQESADFLKKLPKSIYVKADVGVFEYFGVTLNDVQETLEFIAQTAKKRPKLLTSPWFYNKYFTFYRWHGDTTKQSTAIPRGWKGAPEHIRVTQYRITEIYGARHKTKKYHYPLYQLPSDEKLYTSQEKLQHKDSLLRYKYSRSEILNGALEGNTLTQPLAWVTEQGRKELTMQGTALVVFPDKTKMLLQIVGNNGQLKKEQYWYVKQVAKRPKNSAFPVKVKPKAGVTYAADIKVLGFGKVILLQGWNVEKERLENRLGVLVDTGEAFTDNLSKIDCFAGYFPDYESFKAHVKEYPHSARAYILIKNKTAV